MTSLLIVLGDCDKFDQSTGSPLTVAMGQIHVVDLLPQRLVGGDDDVTVSQRLRLHETELVDSSVHLKSRYDHVSKSLHYTTILYILNKYMAYILGEEFSPSNYSREEFI